MNRLTAVEWLILGLAIVLGAAAGAELGVAAFLFCLAMAAVLARVFVLEHRLDDEGQTR